MKVRSTPRSASAWLRSLTPSKRIRSRSPKGRTVSMIIVRTTPPGSWAVSVPPGVNRSGASLHASTTTSPWSPCARATEPTRMGPSGSSVGNLEHGAVVHRGRRRGEKGPQRVRGLALAADHLSEIGGSHAKRVDRGLARHPLVHVHEIGMIHQVLGA